MPRRRRDLDLQIHDHVYSRAGRLTDDCVYCGLPAEGWDHVPPISWAAAVERERAPFLKIPACGECNSILVDRPIFEIGARCWEAKKGLRKKYRKVLEIPEWDAAELAEMRPSLARDIRAHLALARIVRGRLAHEVLKIFD